MKNYFFKKKNNIKINNIIKILNIKLKIKNKKINDIKELDEANKNDISFFHSLKYLHSLKNTKSNLVITNKKYKNFIPNRIKLIEVDNVLLSVYKIANLFYPNSKDDTFDDSAKLIDKRKFLNLNCGKNVLVGKNIKIGKNCTIGHNSIIEQNVRIGDHCQIGNNVILKNCIIGNYTNILDGAVIGKKGFGFFPGKKVNIRYPHIGAVIIGSNVEIGCNNTIDRGSLSNTIIQDGTFLDNQVHIVHNGNRKNCNYWSSWFCCTSIGDR